MFENVKKKKKKAKAVVNRTKVEKKSSFCEAVLELLKCWSDGGRRTGAAVMKRKLFLDLLILQQRDESKCLELVKYCSAALTAAVNTAATFRA